MGIKRAIETDDVSSPVKKARKEGPSSLKALQALEGTITTHVDATRPKYNYNQIGRLIEQARTSEESISLKSSAPTSLCFIFSRLLTAGKLRDVNGAEDYEFLVSRWLNERFVEFGELLLDWVRCDRKNERLLILGLLMQLTKEEVNSMLDRGSLAWANGLYAKLLKTLLMMKAERQLIRNFARDYVVPYQDIEIFTLQSLRSVCLCSSTYLTDVQLAKGPCAKKSLLIASLSF